MSRWQYTQVGHLSLTDHTHHSPSVPRVLRKQQLSGLIHLYVMRFLLLTVVLSAAVSTPYIVGGYFYAILHSFSAPILRACMCISCHQAAGHNNPITRRNSGIQTIHVLCRDSILRPLTDIVLVVWRSVHESFYAALETSVLTFTTTQITVRVTPPFNPTPLAVMGRMSSTVRDFHIFKLLIATEG